MKIRFSLGLCAGLLLSLSSLAMATSHDQTTAPNTTQPSPLGVVPSNANTTQTQGMPTQQPQMQQKMMHHQKHWQKWANMTPAQKQEKLQKMRARWNRFTPQQKQIMQEALIMRIQSMAPSEQRIFLQNLTRVVNGGTLMPNSTSKQPSTNNIVPNSSATPQ